MSGSGGGDIPAFFSLSCLLFLLSQPVDIPETLRCNCQSRGSIFWTDLDLSLVVLFGTDGDAVLLLRSSTRVSEPLVLIFSDWLERVAYPLLGIGPGPYVTSLCLMRSGANKPPAIFSALRYAALRAWTIGSTEGSARPTCYALSPKLRRGVRTHQEIFRDLRVPVPIPTAGGAEQFPKSLTAQARHSTSPDEGV